MSLLYNRALLLAKEEVTFRLDPTPTPILDAVLVEDPVFSADSTILDRNNVKSHLSPDPGTPGRKIATVAFSHEVRHNGNTDGTVSGKLGVLLEGCGYSETAITVGTDTILDDAAIAIAPIGGAIPSGDFTYAKTTAYGGALPRVVQLTCTTPGASATAAFGVFSPKVGDQAEVDLTGQVMEDATPFQLINDTPSADAEITPTVGTSFLAGDTFIINLTPPGFTYSPVSTGFKSLTFWIYYDGLLHKMTGARGTFTVEGEAGSFGKFNFTFTGDFSVATDIALPTTGVFETTIPAQVELANLVAAGGEQDVDFTLCAQSFSIDAGNSVVGRECINEEDSLAGAIITARSPTASFNPETELEADHPFWSNLNTATRVAMSVRIGVEQGNVCTFWAPYAQYSSLAYANRNDIRAYDVNMRLNSDVIAGGVGNDELRITFS